MERRSEVWHGIWKDFFRSWASRHRMEITFFDEDTEDLSFYPNSRYRYSVLMKKKV